MGWLWPGLLHPGTSGLPSGHLRRRPGAESEERKEMLELFVIWGMGKRALWGCGSRLQILEGLSWGRKIRLVLKGLQGVEIKMMDGDDRQSDVSSMNERLLPGRTRKMGRWELPVTRVSKNRQVTLVSGLRKKSKDWWIKGLNSLRGFWWLWESSVVVYLYSRWPNTTRNNYALSNSSPMVIFCAL